MSTITVWMLVAVSAGYYNHGTITVVDRFVTQEDCVFVEKSIRETHSSVALRCIQSRVVK